MPPTTWRRAAIESLAAIESRFLTSAPFDAEELLRRTGAVVRLLETGNPEEVQSLDAWITDLAADIDALDRTAFTPEFSPSESLGGEWREAVAVLAATAEVVRSIRQWNETICLDDVLEAIDAAATAADSQPVEAEWLAIRACRRVAERGERLIEGNTLLGVARNLSFAHPDQTFETVHERVLDAVRTPDRAEFDRLQRVLRDAENREWVRDDLYEFSPREFEFLVADLWGTYGYETTVTSKSNDGGYDIRCETDDELVLIEAKRHAGGVSAPTSTGVAGLIPLFDYDPDRVLLVSASWFTSPAMDRWGKSRSEVGLIAGRELCERLTASPLVPPLDVLEP